MPRRTGLLGILIPGCGPIVIGQAAEFDYSGMHGVRALREEGGRVALERRRLSGADAVKRQP